jgi:peptidyl-prolyl cis-trans isomerase B (cyclophilin B)
MALETYDICGSSLRQHPVHFGRFRRQLLRCVQGFVLAAGLCTSLSIPAQAEDDEYVRLDTNRGSIVIRVFYSIVPYTAGNFLELVDQGFYNGLTWHRVENWVVQGGDPNGNGSGCASDPATGAPKYLRLEINQRLNHNQPGMVAMARSQNPNSASCQFYILKQPMPRLNGQYAVFGKVVDGLHVVYAIRPGDRIVSARILPKTKDEGDSPSNVAPSGGGTQAQPEPEPPPQKIRKDSGF